MHRWTTSWDQGHRGSTINPPVAGATGEPGGGLTRLSAAEQIKLQTLEATVERGQKAFIKAAVALTDIKEQGLYTDYGSIGKYCAKRWEFSKSETSRYLAAGRVLQNLDGFASLPQNKSQALALAKLKSADQQREVWESILNAGEHITAKLVARHVDEAQWSASDSEASAPEAKHADTTDAEDSAALLSAAAIPAGCETAMDALSTAFAAAEAALNHIGSGEYSEEARSRLHSEICLLSIVVDFLVDEVPLTTKVRGSEQVN